MSFRISALVTMIAVVVLLAASNENGIGSPKTLAKKDYGAAQFNAKNELLRPKNYREWVFVGSSLGLGYNAAKKPAKGESVPLGRFKHIYINRLGYDAYRDTGKFPVGTVLILEGVSRGEKTNPQLRGYYSDRFGGMEAAVKTGKRFDDPWNYFIFSQKQSKAKRVTQKSCIRCHRKHAKTDHVFTQFYPVLRDLRKK